MRDYNDLTKKEIKIIKDFNIGERYYFGDIWNGEYNGEELLEDGTYSLDEYNIIAFKIIEKKEDILKTVLEITDIY